jgi:hypothetical protein
MGFGLKTMKNTPETPEILKPIKFCGLYRLQKKVFWLGNPALFCTFQQQKTKR